MLPIAAFAAGMALLSVTAQAQMGASGGGMTTNRGAGSLTPMPLSGSIGPQGNAQGNMGNADGLQGGAQGHAGHGMMRSDAGERQMTDCLNKASAQQRPLNSCRR